MSAMTYNPLCKTFANRLKDKGKKSSVVIGVVMTKLPKLVEEQVKAVSNLKIDKVTVWDSGANGANGKGSTAGFLSGPAGSIPPLHELAKNAGVQLPSYLGKPAEDVIPFPADAPAKTEPEEGI